MRRVGELLFEVYLGEGEDGRREGLAGQANQQQRRRGMNEPRSNDHQTANPGMAAHSEMTKLVGFLNEVYDADKPKEN
jgi:hypothetical protein